MPLILQPTWPPVHGHVTCTAPQRAQRSGQDRWAASLVAFSSEVWSTGRRRNRLLAFAYYLKSLKAPRCLFNVVIPRCCRDIVFGCQLVNLRRRVCTPYRVHHLSLGLRGRLSAPLPAAPPRQPLDCNRLERRHGDVSNSSCGYLDLDQLSSYA